MHVCIFVCLYVLGSINKSEPPVSYSSTYAPPSGLPNDGDAGTEIESAAVPAAAALQGASCLVPVHLKDVTVLL